MLVCWGVCWLVGVGICLFVCLSVRAECGLVDWFGLICLLFLVYYYMFVISCFYCLLFFVYYVFISCVFDGFLNVVCVISCLLVC